MDDTQTSDGALIAAILAGQTDRFEEIVRRYQGALLRVARSRLGRSDWADDVVQETFLCVYRSLASYDSRYSFRTWLWTILLNQCRRRLARDARQPQVRAWTDQLNAPCGESCDAPLEADCKGSPAPPAALLAKERAALLEDILTSLPETQADALRLRFYGGLKYHEIADAMGCSLSSAKNRVKWGLTKMAKLMPSGVAQ